MNLSVVFRGMGAYAQPRGRLAPLPSRPATVSPPRSSLRAAARRLVVPDSWPSRRRAIVIVSDPFLCAAARPSRSGLVRRSAGRARCTAASRVLSSGGAYFYQVCDFFCADIWIRAFSSYLRRGHQYISFAEVQPCQNAVSTSEICLIIIRCMHKEIDLFSRRATRNNRGDW